MTTNESTPKIAKDILELNKSDSYKEFSEGFFTNVPKIKGYLFKFSHLKTPKIYLILNTNVEYIYEKKYIKINEYHFIVYNSKTLDIFLTNIENNLVDILEVLKKITSSTNKNKEEKQGGLPHGYYEDKNGDVQVDTTQANEVRQIFKLYSSLKSIKKVAAQLRTNFSHIRDVLHDERYAKMNRKIVPTMDLKKVSQILFMNRKNKNIR